MYTYKQKNKCKARHIALSSAIELLTIDRASCCCVNNSYVRRLYDFFCEEDGSVCREVKQIDKEYIREWERLQRSYIGKKDVEELNVCYLCGPEPRNDFEELISLGILPHNIWAFENDTESYEYALESLYASEFPKPKIVKINIEKFFKDIPKKFDIFYYDSCGTILSKNAVRVIATMCKYHRLNSPGIIISNFSKPDFSHEEILNNSIEVIEPYFMCKKRRKYNVECLGEDNVYFVNDKEVYNDNIDEYYSDFITNIIMDIASVIIPTQRFANSEYIQGLVEINGISDRDLNLNVLNNIDNQKIYRLVYLCEMLKKNNGNYHKLKKFIAMLSGYEKFKYSLYESFQICNLLSDKTGIKNVVLKNTVEYFEDRKKIYQFLDVPNSSLYLDLLKNQMGYPLHYVTDKIKRYNYSAKTNSMYMDIIPFDECRYIYEWLPTADQVENAFRNKSWQYVFRFAVDGLVKCRMENNNDFFFGNSVVSRNQEGFEEKKLKDRRKL